MSKIKKYNLLKLNWFILTNNVPIYFAFDSSLLVSCQSGQKFRVNVILYKIDKSALTNVKSVSVSSTPNQTEP